MVVCYQGRSQGQQYLAIAFLQLFAASRAILIEENGKDLPSNSNFDLLARIKRPQTGGGGAGCNFNGIRKGKPRTDASGRTFFDLQFVNVGYNYNYDIHCGGGGSLPGRRGRMPKYGGIRKIGVIVKCLRNNAAGPKSWKQARRVKTIGGHFQQGGQDGEHQGGNRPILSALFGNRPLQGIFSQTQTQTQTGIISDTISGLTSLLPKPQDIGQGLGEGISSFVSTLPQIGQSFQSLLPSFENFQFPSLPSFPSPMQGAQVPPTSAPGTGSVTPVGPDQVTDPDDTIYNDDIKPVHEDHDPVTDPHLTNKLPPGQYLVASHPLLGTHTQDLSDFDYLNPFKIHKQIANEVVDFLGDLFAFRR
ncbi:hypothetical protein NQ318_022396 [Aromia moschata]|uniref:Uncharacterized protein n=1 Tax=Aromia moschata TaxID=1265417 RepID=A0AAV8Z7A6_9CUCU|nr:hypothetical protein NQ318_022396 [Aromia moschata]